MKIPTSLALIAAISLAAPLASIADDAYIVPVDRPDKAGNKANFAIEAAQSMNMTLNGEQGQKEDWTASLEVTQTIDKVDAKGNITECSIEIKKFSLVEDGATTEPLPKGSLVKGTLVGGKETFTVEGAPVDEDAQKVLDVAVDLAGPEDSKGDENKAYGADKPHKAGEEWDVNLPELFATMPDDFPFELNKDACKGKMKFVELSGEGDKKVATIQGNVELDVKNMQGMPPGMEFAASSLRIALDGQFPIDAKEQPTRMGLSMVANINGKMQTPEGAAEMKLTISTTQKMKRLP